MMSLIGKTTIANSKVGAPAMRVNLIGTKPPLHDDSMWNTVKAVGKDLTVIASCAGLLFSSKPSFAQTPQNTPPTQPPGILAPVGAQAPLVPYPVTASANTQPQIVQPPIQTQPQPPLQTYGLVATPVPFPVKNLIMWTGDSNDMKKYLLDSYQRSRPLYHDIIQDAVEGTIRLPFMPSTDPRIIVSGSWERRLPIIPLQTPTYLRVTTMICTERRCIQTTLGGKATAAAEVEYGFILPDGRRISAKTIYSLDALRFVYTLATKNNKEANFIDAAVLVPPKTTNNEGVVFNHEGIIFIPCSERDAMKKCDVPTGLPIIMLVGTSQDAKNGTFAPLMIASSRDGAHDIEISSLTGEKDLTLLEMPHCPSQHQINWNANSTDPPIMILTTLPLGY